jgi:hypothetical protein
MERFLHKIVQKQSKPVQYLEDAAGYIGEHRLAPVARDRMQEGLIMTRFFAALLAAALTAGLPAHAGDLVTVASEQGERVARFSIGDSSCVLKDDRIECTRD